MSEITTEQIERAARETWHLTHGIPWSEATDHAKDEHRNLLAWAAPYLQRNTDHAAAIAALKQEIERLKFPPHEGSVDQRKAELLKWQIAWFEKHKGIDADPLQLLWDLEFEAECRGWQAAHDKRDCGHPLAFWQDKNWPASEENYDPETRTSNPPMEYSCLLCAKDKFIADLKADAKGQTERGDNLQRMLDRMTKERDAQAARAAELEDKLSDTWNALWRKTHQALDLYGDESEVEVHTAITMEMAISRAARAVKERP